MVQTFGLVRLAILIFWPLIYLYCTIAQDTSLTLLGADRHLLRRLGAIWILGLVKVRGLQIGTGLDGSLDRELRALGGNLWVCFGNHSDYRGGAASE